MKLLPMLLRRLGLRRAVSAPAPAEPVLTLGAGASLAQIERVEGVMLGMPQAEIPLVHRFAPGVYLRTVTMPAGAQVIGHEHLTDHFNIVLTGRARVLCEGRIEEIVAPAVFRSAAGVRKVLHIVETMTWATIHPTDETDLAKLEAALIRQSDTFQLHAADAARLREGVTFQEAGPGAASLDPEAAS